VDVRERFRIDGVPVSKTVFVKNFWWLKRNIDAKCRDLGSVPAYFRFLTLLGFRIFAEEKVECCILEVGLGGRLDATNLVRAPVVCGITSLGMDHVEVLGDTLAKIAREKAGIFKPRVPAITSPQPEEAMAALKARAAEIEASALTIAPPLRAYEGDAPPDDDGGGETSEKRRLSPSKNIRLGLAGAHQELNAALAVRLVREWAHRARPQPAWARACEADLAAGRLPAAFRRGLAKTEWWGRAQVVPDPTEGAENLSWYLDGAHTEESMRQCAEWFCDATGAADEPSVVGERDDAPGAAREGKDSPGRTKDAPGTTGRPGAEAGDRGDEPSSEAGDRGDDPPSSSAVARVPHPAPSPDPDAATPVRLLLFNCMEERDPETLLAPLAQVLADRGASLTSPALFAPAESSSAGLVPVAGPAESTAWQQTVAKAWDALSERTSKRARKDVAAAGEFKGPSSSPGATSPATDPGTGRAWDAPRASAVAPCLSQAVERIRKTAAEQARLKTGRRVHVLVAGSLYLVGDMLRILGRAG
jgi:folylpolyglutamate synthase